MPAHAGLAKSTTCLALLQMVKSSGQTSTAEQSYILNSLDGLAEFLTKGPVTAIEPNIAEGSISGKSRSLGFSPVQAAGRLRGIRDFVNKPTETDSGERRFTMMTSITGSEEIANFLKFLVDTSKWGSSVYRNQIIRSWQTPISAALMLELLHAIGSLVPLNATIIGTAATVSIESSARYAALHTNGLKGKLEEIADRAENYSKDKWLLQSMNFEIQKELLENSLKFGYSEPWHLSNQEPIDYSSRIAETILMPLMRFFKPQLAQNYRRDANARKNKSWVGVDFFLTTNQVGEPELQIIIRGTHKSPPYPKTSPKPKETQQEDRALSPGQVGVPVRN